jgi:hypothetical protein
MDIKPKTDANGNVLTTITLKDHEQAVTAAVEKATAPLSLQLSQSNAKVTALEEEVKTLKDEQTKRVEKDIADRVNEAFDTYKDAHKLTDDAKKMMTITLRHDPETFEKIYPRVTADKRHLLRDLTKDGAVKGNTRDNASTTDDPTVTKPVPTLNLRDLARAIALKQGISIEQAQRVAVKQLSKQR